MRRACGGLPKFLAAVKTLEEADFTSPQQQQFDAVIDALAARACLTADADDAARAPRE